MNDRQQRAIEHPITGERFQDPRAFDQITNVDEYSVITRLLCNAPLRSMGSWQATAFVLTESGEKCPLIWVSEESKERIRAVLTEMLSGVGQTGVEFNELANGISATKSLTYEEFDQVVENVAGGKMLIPIIKCTQF